jgi:hypothetical protein
MSLESEHDPKEAFYSYVLETIVSLNISFRSVENPLWREMVLWQNHKFPLPSAATLRRRLDIMAVNAQQLALHGLVPGARCALSLDNWSSPGTRISFMGIMATFITAKWEYQEALIGFEYLDGAHTGKELATIVRRVISQYHLEGRVHCITTDNASNNTSMMGSINDMVEELSIEPTSYHDGIIHHIPCFAHIIQLAQRALLGSIRLNPKNSELQVDWDENSITELDGLSVDKGIPWTLAKVCL